MDMDNPAQIPERQPSGSWGTKTSQALLSRMNKVQQTTSPDFDFKFKPPHSNLTLPSSPAQNKKAKAMSSPKDANTASGSEAVDGDISFGLAFTHAVTEPTVIPAPVPIAGSVVVKMPRPVYSTLPDVARSGSISRSASTSKPPPAHLSLSANKPLPQPKSAANENDNDKDKDKASPEWPLRSRSGSLRTATASTPPNVPLPNSPPLTHNHSLRRTHTHSRLPSSSPLDSFSLSLKDTTPPSQDITASTPDHTKTQPTTATTVKPKTKSMSFSLPSSAASTTSSTYYKDPYQPRPITAGKHVNTRPDSMPLFLFGSMQAGKLDFHLHVPADDDKTAETLAMVGEKDDDLSSPSLRRLRIEDVHDVRLNFDKTLSPDELDKMNADLERGEGGLGLKNGSVEGRMGDGNGARGWLGNVKMWFWSIWMWMLDGVVRLSERGAGKGLMLAILLVAVLTFVLGLFVGLAVGFGAS
ncbi:hypothetical protein IFR05_013420 [Cadophora sp. M221]|nr:hypothetical protein IFR05_013420 [Cadophora sp. M221]